jgi:hypothetical protein
MNKVRFWAKYLLVAIGAIALLSAINTVLELLYIQNLLETGVDPTGPDSTWNPVLASIYSTFSNTGSAISLGFTITSIGFLLRASQWLKSKTPDAVQWKPGWAIAAPFVPYAGLFIQYRFLNDLNAGGANDEQTKKRTKFFTLGFVIFTALSNSLTAQQIVSTLTGSETVTFDEFVNIEVMGVITLVLDIAGFVLGYFAIKAINAGLEAKALEVGE